MDSIVLVAAGMVAVTVVLFIIGIYQLAGGGEDATIKRLMNIKSGAASSAGRDGHGNYQLLAGRLSAIPLLDFFFARSQHMGQMAADLERAGLKLRVSEYIAIHVASALLFFLLALIVAGSSPAGLAAAGVLALVGYLLPRFYVKLRLARRLHKLEKQLPETLTIMSNALKAGFGFLQAIDAAVQQMAPPISVELERALRDANLGASIDDSLKALGERVKSKDLDIVLTAILIQREVGGNLAEILDTVAHTIRERERIKGEIKTLTMTQRWEGYVAALIPIGLALLLFAANPDLMDNLLTDPVGRVLLLAAVTWEFIGFLVMKKIVDIDV